VVTLALSFATAAAAYIFFCREVPLTDEEEAAVALLRCRALVPYDAANPEHEELLRTVWEASSNGKPWAGPSGSQWLSLGWQGTNPASDLRAAGHLGAACLSHFARTRPAVFRRLVLKADGVRSSFEYPFCVSCCVLAATLVDSLGVAPLLPGSRQAPHPLSRSFAAHATSQPDAFEEIVVAACIRLDAEWLRAKASYMEHQAVLATTVRAVIAALAQPDVSSVCRVVSAQL